MCKSYCTSIESVRGINGKRISNSYSCFSHLICCWFMFRLTLTNTKQTSNKVTCVQLFTEIFNSLMSHNHPKNKQLCNSETTKNQFNCKL